MNARKGMIRVPDVHVGGDGRDITIRMSYAHAQELIYDIRCFMKKCRATMDVLHGTTLGTLLDKLDSHGFRGVFK